jgi:hypothetical protein
MAKQLIKGMTMLLLVVALAFVTAVVSAYGQSTRSSAEIPFEFMVGNKSLPAGHYYVSNLTAGGEIIKVAAATDATSAARMTSKVGGGAAAESSKLVFNRYGNRYFLAEIWIVGQSQGQKLMKSREEKALQRELASIPSKSDLAQRSYERVEVTLTSGN